MRISEEWENNTQLESGVQRGGVIHVGQAKRKKLKLPPLLLDNPGAVDLIKNPFARISMVYQYRNFMNIITNK